MPTVTLSSPETLEEKINFVINGFMLHHQSMRKYYDDFTPIEHQALIDSPEHEELSQALDTFYKKNAM